MRYTSTLASYTLINQLLSNSMTRILANIVIYLFFLSQLLLVIILSVSTVVRLTINSQNKGALNRKTSDIERLVLTLNEILHWYFTIYPVVYLQIAAITFSSITCNQLSLFPHDDCEQSAVIYILAFSQLLISYIHGQIIIYIMRNHRFNEINSLKRRYSNLILINNTLILLIVMFHFLFEIPYSEIFKYSLANVYGAFQIIDQLTNLPYRDPIRIPSIRLAFMFEWACIMMTLYRFTNLIEEHSLFFAISILALPWAIIGEGLSNTIQSFAMLNYNANGKVEEKYILIAVDNFYQIYLNYLKVSLRVNYIFEDDYSKLRYQEFLLLHQGSCNNKKCYSRPKRLATLNLNDNNDLQTLTLNLIKCIFKTAQTYILTVLLNQDSQHLEDSSFEQLQLQYISFISEIGLRPLIAYIELRKYQNNNKNQNSSYFKEITSKLASQLEKQIIDLQRRMHSEAKMLVDQKYAMAEISLEIQWHSMNLYDQLYDRILKIIDSKVAFWEGLMNGYPSLNPFQKCTQELCVQYMQLQQVIHHHIGIPEEFFDRKKNQAMASISIQNANVNLLTLKIYSLYFAMVVNDFERSNFIENYIYDLVKNDRQKEIGIIDNQSLLMDTTAILLVSFIKNKGKLTNKNQLALANFFGYGNQREFKESIHQLLPPAMQYSHNLLMENFLQRGYSNYFVKKIVGHFVDRFGYLQKAYIKFGNLFEEKDDYVMTASILKCVTSNDTILFDGDGKLIGITEQIFKLIHEVDAQANFQFFLENCYIFFLFPQILSLLKHYQNKITELDIAFIADEVNLIYLPGQLYELARDFKLQQYSDQSQSAITFNLSSWRSWNSQAEAQKQKKLQEDINNSLLLDESIKILGYSIPLLSKEKARKYTEFLLSHKDRFLDVNGGRFQSNQYSIVRMKFTLSLRALTIKQIKYPYFVLELDHVQVIHKDNKNYSKLPSLNKQVAKTLHSINELQSQNKSYFSGDNPTNNMDGSESKKADFFQTTEGDMTRQTVGHPESARISQQLSDIYKSEDIGKEEIEEKLNQIMKMQYEKYINENPQKDNEKALNEPQNNKNRQPLDLSAIDSSSVKLYPKTVDFRDQINQFEKPAPPSLNDSDLIAIDKHFKELEEQQKIEHQQKFAQQEDNISDDQFKENLKNDKDSSIRRKENEEDALNLFTKHKTRKLQSGDNPNDPGNQDHQYQQSQSSSKTATSKSPFLLVRSIYSVSGTKGGLLQFLVSCSLLNFFIFASLFIQTLLVETNYKLLQENIDFVQYPETLNFVFLKLSMLTWIGTEESLNIVSYSEFTTRQVKEDLQGMRKDLDYKLSKLYEGIIRYEKQVLSQPLPLYIVNSLQSHQQELDLTQLIQQLTLHAFNYIDTSNQTSLLTNEVQLEKIISDVIFFMLNLPSIYTFSKQYVSLLNTNLLYYEDKITNDIVFFTIGLLTFIFILIAYQVYIFYQLNQYEESILMLISRVSIQEGVKAIKILLEIKGILNESSSLLWKRVNYFSVVYDNGAQQEQITNYQSIKSSSLSKSVGRINAATGIKNKRSYQNQSLSQRIYDLKLYSYFNFILVAVLFLAVTMFNLGTILVTNDQVNKIKPTLDLNLKIIEFKLQFDSLVVQGEILKTQKFMQQEISKKFPKSSIAFNSKEILSLFTSTYKGFQFSMSDIYDQLVSNKGLLEDQKQNLLRYFERSLCETLPGEIPFCQISGNMNNIPSDFITKYGSPELQDNNYEYVSGGIVNIVHEFVKTIVVSYTKELLQQNEEDSEAILLFLRSSSHITQFIEYYVDQGKLLIQIGYELLDQNRSKLNEAIVIMQLYIYLIGVFMVSLMSVLYLKWFYHIKQRLKLMKLSLTLLPYEVLLEAKTVTALKNLEYI